MAGLVIHFNEFFFFEARAHTAATTTCSGFDHDREADLLGQLQTVLGRIKHSLGTGGHRYAVCDGGRTGSVFVTHFANKIRRRPDEFDLTAFTNFNKASVL